MKILSVCYEDMGGYIGGVRQVVEIGRALFQLGHQIEVISPDIRRYKESLPFKIRYLPIIHKKILQPLSYSFTSLFYLIKSCFIFKPDIIFTYEIFSSFIPMLVAKIFSLPYVVFVNGDTEDFRLQHFPLPLLWMIEFIRRFNLEFCDGVVTVTEGLKDALVKKYKFPVDKIIVVNNGVDSDYFRPLGRNEVLAKLGFDRSNFYIGFLGGMWPWHGLDLLIKSAPLILAKIPNARFILAGHGPERETLISLIREMKLEQYFILKGEIAFKEVVQVINSFDAGILFFKPVRKNPGCPIKLFEYLACGKPVIATDIDNYGRLLENYSAGIAVNSDDPATIAKAIIKLAQDEKLRQQMGEAARGIAVKQFSWRSTAQAIERSLQRYLLR